MSFFIHVATRVILISIEIATTTYEPRVTNIFNKMIGANICCIFKIVFFNSLTHNISSLTAVNWSLFDLAIICTNI